MISGDFFGLKWRLLNDALLRTKLLCTLRDHPVSFLHADPRRKRFVSCRDAMQARDGQWLQAAGLVLVRQRPGSARPRASCSSPSRMRPGIANLVGWVKVFEKYRRVVLSAGMIGIYGRIQREGEVVHLVAHRLGDLCADLASVGECDCAFPLPHGRGDEFHHGGPTPDPRGLPKGPRRRNIIDPYLHIRPDQGEEAGFQIGRSDQLPKKWPRASMRAYGCLRNRYEDANHAKKRVGNYGRLPRSSKRASSRRQSRVGYCQPALLDLAARSHRRCAQNPASSAPAGP